MLTCYSLSALRSEAEFTKFWANVMKKAADVSFEEPVLPRRRRLSPRIDTGHGEVHFPASVEDHYRSIYYEALLSLVR